MVSRCQPFVESTKHHFTHITQLSEWDLYSLLYSPQSAWVSKVTGALVSYIKVSILPQTVPVRPAITTGTCDSSWNFLEGNVARCYFGQIIPHVKLKFKKKKKSHKHYVLYKPYWHWKVCFFSPLESSIASSFFTAVLVWWWCSQNISLSYCRAGHIPAIFWARRSPHRPSHCCSCDSQYGHTHRVWLGHTTPGQASVTFLSFFCPYTKTDCWHVGLHKTSTHLEMQMEIAFFFQQKQFNLHVQKPAV